MKIINMLYVGILIVVLNGCGSSSNDEFSSGNESSSKFDNAREINLGELDDYSIINGADDETSNVLRDSNDEDTQQVSKSILKINSMIESDFNKLNNKSSIYRDIIANKVTNDNEDIKVFNETEEGSISGSLTRHSEFNMKSGEFFGTITFDNFRDKQYNECWKSEEIFMDGIMKFSGSINTESEEIETVVITSNEDFIIDDTCFKKNFSFNIKNNNNSIYEEDCIFTITADMYVGYENLALKDFTVRSYSDNVYEYSYPIEGKLYIFTDELNGYFSVDSSYDHNNTPTKEDICGEYTYSGKEKYVGYNSTLTYTITSINNYKIEIDSDNDGVIDKTFTGLTNE